MNFFFIGIKEDNVAVSHVDFMCSFIDSFAYLTDINKVTMCETYSL